MSDDIRLEGPGDFGPHTEVRLSNPIENVPVKHCGEVIGWADIDEGGVIHATIDSSKLDVVTRRRLFGPHGEFSITPNLINRNNKKGTW